MLILMLSSPGGLFGDPLDLLRINKYWSFGKVRQCELQRPRGATENAAFATTLYLDLYLVERGMP